MAVHLPNGSVVDDSYFTIVFNTNPYTYLGTRPFNLAPDAGLDRGLVVLAIRTLSAVPFLTLVASGLMSGKHVRHSRHTAYRTDLASATVSGYGPVPYQVDGDYLGEAEHLEFRHEPDVLPLVMPT
jgi:diacylglycerol kinase family enzyme